MNVGVYSSARAAGFGVDSVPSQTTITDTVAPVSEPTGTYSDQDLNDLLNTLQSDPDSTITEPVEPSDSTLSATEEPADSTLAEAMAADSVLTDSLPAPPKKKSGLDAPVFGSQQDSMVYDVRNRDLYLFGQGDVKYTNMGIKAERIKLDLDGKEVEARGTMMEPAEPKQPEAITVDTVELEYKRPEFKEGEDLYELDSVRYNFDSQKAMIWGVRTQEGEGYITGGTVKKMPDNVIHMRGGRYTTCDKECPHYWLQMTKGVVEPKKNVVFGPAYMVFEDVPFYILGLPFGFFPQHDSRSSGFILPSFGEEAVRGFFLREGGYYHVFSEYLDAKLTGGIYTLGSWETNLESQYKKRYKYEGRFSFDYAKDIFGEKGSADYVDQSNMRVRWTHTQDPKFRPNSTFAASVDYSSSKYNRYNANNMNDYVSSQTSSSISYSKNWAGKPYSLSITANHSQNLRDSSMSLNFPTMVFNVSRVTPFKRKEALGKEKWYEKISLTYTANMTSNSQFKQNEFLKQEMFDNMKFGVQHQVPVSASFNLLNYLNVTPSVNYTERWYFRKIYQDWNPDTERVEVTDTTRGFYRVYNYSFSLATTTRIYGMYTFGGKKKAKPTQLRHVITPNFSLSYTPDFGKQKYGYYETIQSNKQGDTRQYSPFANEPYGVPGSAKSLVLGFSFGNTFELKTPSVRNADSTGYRKIKLIEALNISSSYNFTADSLKLAPFSVNLRTTLFKNVSLNVNSTFDPYQIDENGRRIDKFFVRTGKGLARLTSVSTGFSYGFNSPVRADRAASNNPLNNDRAAIDAALNDPANQNEFFSQTQNEYVKSMQRAQMLASQYYDFNIPWSASFNYTFGFRRNGLNISRTQTVNFSGSVNLTEKWAVEFGAGYDFIMNKLTPGTVMIRRDLHCFQATFSWVPVGFRQSWSFSIRAKSSILSDVLRYKKSNSFLDNYYRY